MQHRGYLNLSYDLTMLTGMASLTRIQACRQTTLETMIDMSSYIWSISALLQNQAKARRQLVALRGVIELASEDCPCWGESRLEHSRDGRTALSSEWQDESWHPDGWYGHDEYDSNFEGELYDWPLDLPAAAGTIKNAPIMIASEPPGDYYGKGKRCKKGNSNSKGDAFTISGPLSNT
eukprot:2646638-Pyramimonas_sp.AAC.1